MIPVGRRCAAPSGLAGIDIERLLEASFDGIIVSDAEGRVLFANEAVGRITGTAPADLVGKSAVDLVREGKIPYATSLEAMRTGQPFTRIQKYENGKTAIVTSSPLPAASTGAKDPPGENAVRSAPGDDIEAGAAYVLTNLRDVSLLHDLTPECRDEEGSSSCIFTSPAMKKVLEILSTLAAVDSTVLFEGETGVGKDVLARILHNRSRRRSGPFIKVSCGALPESLLESELFGYEGGSFTGAHPQGKRGLVEASRGGTFFLDEIEALPLGLQPAFLELLQDKTFNRVGGVKKVEADIRVMAASNRDLAALVRERRFREDLFYRLNVVPVRIPPLRERADDIIPLTRLFLDRFNARYGMNRGISNDVFPLLLSHPWPGNVRELSNLVENLVLTHREPLVDVQAVETRLGTGETREGSMIPGIREAREEAERRLLDHGRAAGLTTREMAALLGVSQPTISRKLRKYFGFDAEMNRRDRT